MNVGGDAADELVKETIYFSSEAAKLAGLGIKNLAAMLWAMSKDHEQSPGRTKIAKVLANTSMPKVARVKVSDRKEFERLAKEAGISFAPPIKYKSDPDQMLNYIFGGERVAQMNLVLKELGYDTLKENEGKNGEDRAAPSGRSSSERERTGGTATSTTTRDDDGASPGGGPGGNSGGPGGRRPSGQEDSVGAKFAAVVQRTVVSTARAPTGRSSGMDR